MAARATPKKAVPMVDETIASIIPLHQPKKAKTGAQRARAYRQRKTAKSKGRGLVRLRITVLRITDTGALFVGGFDLCRTTLYATPDRRVTRRRA
jgi:hypothetical protein